MHNTEGSSYQSRNTTADKHDCLKLVYLLQGVRPPPPTRGPVPPPRPTRSPQPGRCPIPPMGDGYREMRMDNNYVLYWRSLPDGRSIMFVACVRTDGWVGLGISPGGSMLDSDVVIGWIRPDNSPGFQVSFPHTRWPNISCNCNIR